MFCQDKPQITQMRYGSVSHPCKSVAKGYAFLFFDFALQQSPLWSFMSCFIVAPSSFIMSHESPLQQQHDSMAQQASAFFFCSHWAGVWAIPAVNANSSMASSMIRVVCLRGFILVLLYLKVSACVPVRAHVMF